MVGEGQVFEVFTDGTCVAKVVELCEQCVVKGFKMSASDLTNGNGSEGRDVSRDRSLIYRDGFRNYEMAASGTAPFGWQFDETFGLKAQEKASTNSVFEVSIWLSPVPELADSAR